MQQHPGNEHQFAVVKSSGDDGKDAVEGALAAGDPQRVGWFRFYFDDDRWEWSPQVEKMHGYLPGTVNPTTEMVLAHKHPDDYRQIADTLDLIRQALRKGTFIDDDMPNELDLDSVEAVLESLSSREPSRVIAAMDLLAERKRSRLIPALGDLYYDGLSLACVAELSAAEATARLEAAPADGVDIDALYEAWWNTPDG